MNENFKGKQRRRLDNIDEALGLSLDAREMKKVQPRQYMNIEDLPNEHLDLFSLGDTQHAKDLFKQYEESKLPTEYLTQASAGIHQRVSQTRVIDCAASAIAEIVEEVSKLLFINLTTPQIAKALGLQHKYVLKIKRFVDKKLQNECTQIDTAQLFWNLKRQNEVVLNTLTRQFMKEGNTQTPAYRDLLALAGGINDTTRTQSHLIEKFDKARPVKQEGLSESERKLEKFKDSLLEIMTDSIESKEL